METIVLPSESWGEYRQLRLRALKEDQEAFSSRYEDALHLPEDFWRTRLDDAGKGNQSWLLFARREDKLIGMIGAYMEAEVTDTATIVSVYVPREERGKGISTRLMMDMLSMLSMIPGLKKARLDVNVSQAAAIRLYEQFGFRETGRKPATTGAGQAVEQVAMERDLPV